MGREARVPGSSDGPGPKTTRLRDPAVHADFARLRGYLAPPGPWTPSDVILCFGCDGTSVPRRAARLFRHGLAPWLVVSGRGPAHRREPEADAFARVLVGAGVPRERIVLERTAANTGENVVRGLAAAHDRGLPVRSVTVVAHVDGVRRCLATLQRRVPEVVARPSPVVYRGPASLRAIADALAELHRLRTYPALGYIAPQREPPAVRAAAARLARVVARAADSGVDPTVGGVVTPGSVRESEHAALVLSQ